jgi:hypothetical protein
VPYSPEIKEAFASWIEEFLDGLRADVAIPKDWTTIRTILILILTAASSGNRPAVGEQLCFELPAGIAIGSLRTEAHLFLFDNLPPDPQ